jgi:phosphonopyruvate decarboxylase
MINLELFTQKLQENNVEFITGVPDTLLNDLCLHIEKEWPKEKHIIAANEGNSVALAAGYHLATGTVPLVYMQNSGIGNTVNPLLSLTHKQVFSIPLVLLIGWRGEPGRNDHAQHQKQGELTPTLMEAMDIPYRIISNNTEEALTTTVWAIETAKRTNNPVALLATKGVFEKGEKAGFDNEDNQLLSREEAINSIIDLVPNDSIFVASTGRATRELYEIRNIRTQGHEKDFLNVGAMGHTSSIAMGLAIGSSKKVICLEGDSSAIMHLGSLTTAGKCKPKNFIHVVLNNGVHESVGGQESAGFNADLTRIAENSGYITIGNAVKTKKDIQTAFENLISKKGPVFLEIIIRKGMRQDMPPLKFDLKFTKDELMKDILSQS